MPGLRQLNWMSQPRWFKRIAVGHASPVRGPVHIKPTVAPSGTAVAGDLYFNSTANALYQHNGSSYAEVGTAPVGNVTIATTKVLAVTDAAGITIGGVIPTLYEFLTAPTIISSSSASFTLFLNPNVSQTFKVAGASVVFGTASTSGTMQVEVATGTQAIGAGTVQLTGTMSLSGTANTTVNGTVIGSPTTIAAGNRVNVILAGTLTSLANCMVTVALQRLT